MKCQIENCVRNSHGYCDGSLYVHIDQNGLCDNMDLIKPTNAQKIRAMSDEEFAELLISADFCGECKYCDQVGLCRYCDVYPDRALNDGCKRAAINWLGKPAEEDT